MTEAGQNTHYHLIGIAGTAMGSLAGLLRAKGHRVTGSDSGVYPPMSTQLEQLGIEYASEFSPANLEPAPDVVVVGNAISRGNPELEAVLERRLRYTSAASVIKEEFLRSRHVVAVAGTHGKTTTTSLVAWLLETAGLNPSFLIGGIAENFGASFRLTDSEYFVIEADEYDTAYFDKGPKMWHYLPWTAVVTNIEFDHADIYEDLDPVWLPGGDALVFSSDRAHGGENIRKQSTPLLKQHGIVQEDVERVAVLDQPPTPAPLPVVHHSPRGLQVGRIGAPLQRIREEERPRHPAAGDQQHQGGAQQEPAIPPHRTAEHRADQHHHEHRDQAEVRGARAGEDERPRRQRHPDRAEQEAEGQDAR